MAAVLAGSPEIGGDVTFYAFSAFWSVWSNYFNDTNRSPAGVATLQQLQQKNNEVCSMSLQQLQTAFTSPYLSQFCMSSSYVLGLLVDGYGFPIDTQQVIFIDSIPSNGEDIEFGWSLGAMLYNVNHFAYSIQAPNDAAKTALALGIVSLCLIGAIGSIWAYRQCHASSRKESGYIQQL